jgi:hypothetical protein
MVSFDKNSLQLLAHCEPGFVFAAPDALLHSNNDCERGTTVQVMPQ